MRRCFWIMVALVAAADCPAYSPYVDCARAWVKVHVVDDLGESVSGADVSAVFYVAPAKTKVVKGVTDKEGNFEATQQCNGELHLLVTKNGYYDTYFEPQFVTSPENVIERTRQWSQGPVAVKSVLKKRRTPATLVLKGGVFQELGYPATNVVMGLDLLMFDWCPPFGKGKYDDLQIKYDFWRSQTNWLQVYSHLDVTMTNCLDGVYLLPTDDFSRMNRCYAADTNAVYRKRIEFVYDRKSGNVERNVEMPRDKFMVFRTRTKVNDRGELVSAHYGLIFEKSEYGIRLNMRTAFNPRPNDTNLEREGGWR